MDLIFNAFCELFVMSLLVEALTQALITATPLAFIRDFFMVRWAFFRELLSCKYCFSFWVSVLVVSVFSYTTIVPQLIGGPKLLNFIVLLFITHRGSNMVHGLIDRYFDTTKDIRYNKQ